MAKRCPYCGHERQKWQCFVLDASTAKTDKTIRNAIETLNVALKVRKHGTKKDATFSKGNASTKKYQPKHTANVPRPCPGKVLLYSISFAPNPLISMPSSLKLIF